MKTINPFPADELDKQFPQSAGVRRMSSTLTTHRQQEADALRR
jgi:hypothetical protein